MSPAPLFLCLAVLASTATVAQAKLPAPSDEAKAKAAEAAAKTAHGTKVSNFQLCKSMDRTAAVYFAQAKKDSKAVQPADASAAACADPGAFVYTPAVPVAAGTSVAAGPTAAPTSAPAAPPAVAPKK